MTHKKCFKNIRRSLQKYSEGITLLRIFSDSFLFYLNLIATLSVPCRSTLLKFLIKTFKIKRNSAVNEGTNFGSTIIQSKINNSDIVCFLIPSLLANLCTLINKSKMFLCLNAVSRVCLKSF